MALATEAGLAALTGERYCLQACRFRMRRGITVTGSLRPRDFAMTEDTGRQSWWQTLPGILTALGGVITAIASLAGVISQTGLFGHKENPLSAESRPVPPSPNPPPRPQPDNGVRTVHTGIDYFLGAWINIDPNTGSVPKLSVSLAGQNVLVHAWGACHPTPCDWGEVQAEPYASTVSSKISSDTTKLQGVFKPAFAETTFSIYPEGEERLRFERSTRFTDNSGRANYSSMDIFQRAK
jgi:hypothetical protein